MIEIWKDIEGYEGLYQISNLGRVKSLNYRNTKREQNIKLTVCKGYYMARLYKDGKSKRYQVSRLVAKAFIPNPKNKLQVDHINGDKLNNNLLNLRWVSPRENILGYGYKQRIETLKKISKEKGIHLVKAIPIKGTKVVEFELSKKDKKYGFDYSHVLKCLKGIEKTHKGYIFQKIGW